MVSCRSYLVVTFSRRKREQMTHERILQKQSICLIPSPNPSARLQMPNTANYMRQSRFRRTSDPPSTGRRSACRRIEVRTKETFPIDWAGTQNNVRIAYRNLPTGDREENLRRAIACYEAALKIFQMTHIDFLLLPPSNSTWQAERWVGKTKLSIL